MRWWRGRYPKDINIFVEAETRKEAIFIADNTYSRHLGVMGDHDPNNHYSIYRGRIKPWDANCLPIILRYGETYVRQEEQGQR